MKLSARNVFKGKVKEIVPGSINDEIVIEVAPGIEVVSQITKKSVERLGLKKGSEAYAVIKSSSVIVAVD